jgi:hypothetical protein
MTDSSLTRRDFLARAGILGAVAALYGVAGPGVLPSWAQSPDDLAPILAAIRTTLQQLALDTFHGLSAFGVPGNDEYSIAQGVATSKPGAIAAKNPEFLVKAADFFVAFPDRNTAGIAVALAEGLKTSPLSLPPELANIPLTVSDQLDDAVRAYAENDQVIPLSLVFALAINQLAVVVNPLAVSGNFLSPFARLTYAEKLAAWEMFEGGNADIVAMIDANLPQPQTESVSGVLRFAAGALLEFVGFGTFGGFDTFDTATRKLTGRPVGWQLTGYQPNGGPVNGWDEFKGYYQGRKSVSG